MVRNRQPIPQRRPAVRPPRPVGPGGAIPPRGAGAPPPGGARQVPVEFRGTLSVVEPTPTPPRPTPPVVPTPRATPPRPRAGRGAVPRRRR